VCAESALRCSETRCDTLTSVTFGGVFPAGSVGVLAVVVSV
jgi:hypothetical protein